MPHLPDHATHDPELIAAFAAGDATGPALDEATALVAACTDCAALHRDLRAITTALPELPAPARRRDFRLTPEQTDALRPSGWRGLVAAFASPRFRLAAPLGTGLAAAGLAGLLLATPGGLSGAGGATSEATASTPAAAAAPEAAAGAAPAASAPAQDEIASGTDVTITGQARASSDEPKAAGAAPSAAALAPMHPAPSPSAAASSGPELLYATPREAGASPDRYSAISAGDPSVSRVPDRGANEAGGVLRLNTDGNQSAPSGAVPDTGGVVLPVLALASLIVGMALIGLRVASRRIP